VNLTFSQRELQDLAIAWIVLGVAFAIFFAGGGSRAISMLVTEGLVQPLVVSLVTAGLGFLLHELAHKVVAVRFDQIAEFRADYSMLFLAVMSALVGFLFAAPGAVHHRGRITAREHGLIALAGPVTNGLLAVVFTPIYVAGLLVGSPLLSLIGGRGVAINLFLAAFNLVPFGGLDGRTVLDWSKGIFVLTFVPAAAVTVYVVFVLGIGF
jgi:Zn-dependent protease